ncbi:MAG: sodium:proton antiporter [Agathobacter sp.]|nr:sodium:proton antiporter [Agathobacter sp.]
MIAILIYLMVFMPMAGALVSYLIGRKNKTARDYFVAGLTILEFIFAALLVAADVGHEGTLVYVPEVCGMGLTFTVDGFRVLYAAIACFMWMCTSVFSKEYFAHYHNRNRYYLFQLLTLGATAGIFLSADLYTTFIFFEVMSISSYVWVAHDETAPSMRAAATYLAVAIIGGLTLLMGLFLLYNQTGTLLIGELYEACQGKNVYAACLCMLVGFGAKAGAFPLQIWLPKAHPVAPAPASALLSGILTKTGIFGVLVISCQILLHDVAWGAFILVIGLITMFLGALLAVFSIDFKRTLACSSVSQIGFILVGVGMQGLLGAHNEIAIRGTVLHMVNHSLFKLVLFMAAGVIYMNIHKLDLNDIRGFGRKKPLLKFIYLMGALGIGGIPLWSGYISKTLLHESMVEYIHEIEGGHILNSIFSLHTMEIFEWIFLISGGMTIAYMLKLYVAVFVEKNKDAAVQEKYDGMKKYMNPVSAIVLTACATIFPIFGTLPYATMDVMADMSEGFMGWDHAGHSVDYFTWVNLKGSVISIIIGVTLYFGVVRTLLMKKQADGSRDYANRWWKYFDLEDYFYRPVLLKFLPTVCAAVCLVIDRLVDGVVVILRKTIYKDSLIYKEMDEGNTVTYALGSLFNRGAAVLNKTVWRSMPRMTDYRHRFALKYASFKENFGFIERSLSYGLILFCLGLCAVLIYLLVAAFV